jgi:DNA-binding NarL/FixJ family response regulator
MTGSAPPPQWTTASIDPQHEAVYALADQGKATAEIARQLNRPNGEIELILALRARV